jgi:hypothetical protein
VVLVAVAATYAVLFAALGGFSSGARKDENFFWPAVEFFSRHWVPSIDELQSYPAPPTPLTFLVWGAIEHLTGNALVIGRIINVVLSLGLVALVLAGRSGTARARVLNACGLLACPYFAGVSLYLYTDIPASAFAAIGTLAYLRGRHTASMICMTLAIACRQYMVAFPLALAAWEFWRSLDGAPGWRLWLSRAGPCVKQACAALTLLGWIVLFGGLSPRGAVEQFQVLTANPTQVFPQHALYFITCVGAYFVIVEAVLFRDLGAFRALLTARGIAMATLLAALFLAFPPVANDVYGIPWMGYLDRGARLLLQEPERIVVYWFLAALVAARFGRVGPGALMVLFNALLLIKAHQAWDKYTVPLLIVLWVLRAQGALETLTPGVTGASLAHRLSRAWRSTRLAPRPVQASRGARAASWTRRSIPARLGACSPPRGLGRASPLPSSRSWQARSGFSHSSLHSADSPPSSARTSGSSGRRP